MRRLIIAPRAQAQIERLLRDSERRFGERSAERYRRLLAGALELLRSEPLQPSSVRGPTNRVSWLYHLGQARRLAPPDERVKRPRRFIVYRFTETHLEVAQVLHDAMDIADRLEKGPGSP